MSERKNLRNVPAVPCCILVAVAVALYLLLAPWASGAAYNPDEPAQRTPAPLQFPPPLPYSAPGLYPPGLDPREPWSTTLAEIGAAGQVPDPVGDVVEATLGWPYQGANYGVTVSGKSIEVATHAFRASGDWWYAALFQDVSGELQERDHAPNDSVLAMSSDSSASDEYGDASPVWMDLSNVSQKCCTADGRRVFTTSLWAEIPSSAWDMIFMWPIYDYSGHLLHIQMAYQGPLGWERVVSSNFMPTNVEEADIHRTTVRRGPDGWIELELVSGLTTIEPYPYPYFGIYTWHALYRWYFDSDNNAYTGAPSGADIAVELRQNADTRTYEALVLRWDGKFWVTKLMLQPPAFTASTKTTLIRVGPASLGLGSEFAWWLSSSMWIGWNRDMDRANPWVTNQIDRAPDRGVVSEGADFWVIPTRTPTPSPTPTRTPTRTSTPAPLVIQGTVRYGSYGSTSRDAITGAAIWADQKQGAAWITLGQATTDANGRYQITLTVTRSADYRLRCRIAGPLGPRDQAAENTGIGAGYWSQDFWFEPVIRVRGQVTTNGGKPEPYPILRRVFCGWNPACVTWPSTWWDSTKFAYVSSDADGRFDADGYFPGGPPDSIRLKLSPPEGQRVANVAVPDGCEALALDLVECLNLQQGVYDGVKFDLAPALTPTPTPSATPTGPWIAWTDPDGLPIGAAGRTVSLRFEALPYTDTLTVTLGPGLEFTDGTTQKEWALKVLRGRMAITVRALATHLGQQSWIRGAILGMEDTLPVRLVWQTWLPGTFRHTGWRSYAFGVRFVDADTNQPLRATFAVLDKCTEEPCDDWLILTSEEVWTPDAKVVWEPEGMKPPFTFRIQFSTVCDCWNKYYVLDRVDVDGPGVLGEYAIEYRNLPSGRYVNNVVYLRPVPRP